VWPRHMSACTTYQEARAVCKSRRPKSIGLIIKRPLPQVNRRPGLIRPAGARRVNLFARTPGHLSGPGPGRDLPGGQWLGLPYLLFMGFPYFLVTIFHFWFQSGQARPAAGHN
jgi:hypothetical protein